MRVPVEPPDLRLRKVVEVSDELHVLPDVPARRDMSALALGSVSWLGMQGV
jgi:hypothetical protein